MFCVYLEWRANSIHKVLDVKRERKKAVEGGPSVHPVGGVSVGDKGEWAEWPYLVEFRVCILRSLLVLHSGSSRRL